MPRAVTLKPLQVIKVKVNISKVTSQPDNVILSLHLEIIATITLLTHIVSSTSIEIQIQQNIRENAFLNDTNF